MTTNRKNLQQCLTDWQVGFADAVAGLPQHPVPASVKDRLAYTSGWIEGDNLRLAQKIVRLPPEKRKLIDSLLDNETAQNCNT